MYVQCKFQMKDESTLRIWQVDTPDNDIWFYQIEEIETILHAYSKMGSADRYNLRIGETVISGLFEDVALSLFYVAP